MPVKDDVNDGCSVPHAAPCGALLPPHTIIAVLDEHGYATTGVIGSDRVWVWEESSTTLPGLSARVDSSGWVVAPDTVHELAVWLGY